MENIWTVQNGALGTAHENRYGVVVDFRPATIQVESEKIVIAPAKGVKIEKLHLDPDEIDRVEEERDTPYKGMVTFKQEFRKEFQGVIVTARTDSQREWYDDAAEEISKKAGETSMEKFHAQMKVYKDFLDALPFEKIAAELTRRDVGRLKSGRRQVDLPIQMIFRKFLIEEFPGILTEGSVRSVVYQTAKEKSAGLMEFLLEREKAERERRKAEWAQR
jgi:hypothetical protein